MISATNTANYKSLLAATFDARTNYDDQYTVRRATGLIELARLDDGARVLDLATGTGIVAINAARKVGPRGHVTGVDISRGMLDQARRKIQAAGLQNLQLIEADVECVDFESQHFDAILCSSAFMWLTDIPATLRRCRTWLKEGGLLTFSCYSESSFMIPVLARACARFGIHLPNCNEPLGTSEKCRALLQNAGFNNVEIQAEDFGSYLQRNDMWWAWPGDSNWIAPGGNPLGKLSNETLSQIKAAYDLELDALATDRGLWHEITMFFVTARKSAGATRV